VHELALFAGAGGGIIGGMLLGWRTVCAVEIEDYPRRVLLQRQADGILPRFPIWDDVTTFDGKPWRGKVDVISGGFPCQDISAAGKGEGITGARSGLWGEMARIIGEVRPRYAFVENSPLLVGRGLAVVLGDLAAMGYDAKWCIVSASDAGASHRRDRIWILAHAKKNGSCRNARALDGAAGELQKGTEQLQSRLESGGCCSDVADSESTRARENNRGIRAGIGRADRGEKPDQEMADTQITRLEGWDKQGAGGMGGGLGKGCKPIEGQWEPEPAVGRVADGVADILDKSIPNVLSSIPEMEDEE